MDNIVSLKGEPSATSSKQAFLDAAAIFHDGYIERFGVSPDAFVFTFGGLRSPTVCGWQVRGECEGAAVPLLSAASTAIVCELVSSARA